MKPTREYRLLNHESVFCKLTPSILWAQPAAHKGMSVCHYVYFTLPLFPKMLGERCGHVRVLRQRNCQRFLHRLLGSPRWPKQSCASLKEGLGASRHAWAFNTLLGASGVQTPGRDLA